MLKQLLAGGVFCVIELTASLNNKISYSKSILCMHAQHFKAILLYVVLFDK